MVRRKLRKKATREGKGDRRDPRRGFKARLAVVTLIFAFLGAAVITRAVFLQVLQHTDLTERAVAQYRKSVYLSPTRGVIRDRRGRELAANVEAFSAYAETPRIRDKASAARKLAPILDQPVRRVLDTLTGRDGFVWLKRQMNPKESRSIRELEIKGVGLLSESRRFYPQRELASQLIGFAGIDSQGLEGIEFAYDRYLRGNAGWLVVQRDALDRSIFVEGYQADPDNRGLDLALTIDRTVQYFAQEGIRQAVEKTGAREGVIVVMEPETGEILGMAISTYFNPNNRANLKEGRWKNICLANIYEPGSTMKPFILAAALEGGLARTRDRIDCSSGSITLHGTTIKDAHPSGVLSVAGVITESSNVGAIKIGQKLTPEDFHQGLLKFGFGAQTGIDLPGESAGLVRAPSAWSGLSQASMSIGQEIGVTPLQLTAAYAALANGGLLCRPRVVGSIQRDGETVKQYPTEVVRRVVSRETSAILREILRGVVEEGTGGAAAIPGYSVAGKTGTAQKFDKQAGGYSTDKYLSSFIGFAPVHDPAVVILVILDEPTGPYYGGSVAAPVFASVGARVLDYLAVPHDRPLAAGQRPAPAPGGNRAG